MAKEMTRNNPAKSTDEIQNGGVLDVIPKLTPAAVIGVNSKVHLNPDELPAEFRGATVEILETGFAPTVKWNEIGNYVAGIYEGVETVKVMRKTGTEDNNIYQFSAKGKAFGVWGTTVLDRAFKTALDSNLVKPGYMVLIAYVGNIEVNQPEPLKMFQIQVIKK